MDSSLLIAAGASFLAGLLGYMVARLWIKPIAGYQVVKRKLDHELVRYLVQLEEAPRPGDQAWRRQAGATLKAARKAAMDLVSRYGQDIPYWYRLLLDSRRQAPAELPGLLANLAKINDLKQVRGRIDRARKILGSK